MGGQEKKMAGLKLLFWSKQGEGGQSRIDGGLGGFANERVPTNHITLTAPGVSRVFAR